MTNESLLARINEARAAYVETQPATLELAELEKVQAAVAELEKVLDDASDGFGDYSLGVALNGCKLR